MTMPGDITFGSNTTYFGKNLTDAVNAEQVSMDRIDDMSRRILAGWYLLGQDRGFPPVNLNASVQGNHGKLIREIAAAGTVLLKNDKKLLPLSSDSQSVAIVGTGAGPNSQGLNGCPNARCNDGVLAVGWGSGAGLFPYLITPLDAISTRVNSSGGTVTTLLSDTNLAAAAEVATGKDIALVFITADSGEGSTLVEGNAGDRKDLFAWHGGDALVAQVASVNPNTVVVVNSVGPIVMEAWIENVNVSAVVWANLPGQEAGNSIADILFGDVNPSARLPYTIGKSENDYSAQIVDTATGSITEVPYSDTIFIDYRHFDKFDITPRFEFGFGLSYTTFKYDGPLRVTGALRAGASPCKSGASLNSEKSISVSFTVRNTGKVAGSEIPQLYLTLPASANAPPRILKGFESVPLRPGERKTVTMELSRYDFSFWDTTDQAWKVAPGRTVVSVGKSSRDIQLTTSIRAS